MQYAQILTKQKTKDWDATFTYEITPEVLPSIKIGSIVEVPFGNKKIEGVVVGLKKTIPSSIKIKKIIRLIQPNLIISQMEIAFSKWLARQYLTTWSEALFAMIPPLPKKDISRQQLPTQKMQKFGRHYILNDFDSSRYDYYLEILKKNNQKGQAVWLIFADLKILDNFLKLKKTELSKYNLIAYSSADNLITRFKKWQTIRSGQYDLMVSSRMGLLNLPKNVATIIIDEPSQNGHQEDQSPRYHSLDLAKYWQKTLGINILSGDILPSLQNLVEAKNSQAVLLSKKIPQPKCAINLIDMVSEKRLLSHSFEKSLEETVENRKTMLIYLPKKGMGSATRCQDCGHTFTCPKCGSLYTYHQYKKELICHKCNHYQKNSAICPKCRGNNIRTFGLGLEKIAGFIKTIVGDYPIILVDKEHELPPHPSPAIIIATQAALRYSLSPDITVIVDADLSLNNPDYTATEEMFYLIYKLATLTKEKLYIQTHEPQLKIYQSLQAKKPLQFINELLQERHDHQYPPYGELINIFSKNFSSVWLEEMKKVFPGANFIGPTAHQNASQLVIKSRNHLSRSKLRPFLLPADKIITSSSL